MLSWPIPVSRGIELKAMCHDSVALAGGAGNRQMANNAKAAEYAALQTLREAGCVGGDSNGLGVWRVASRALFNSAISKREAHDPLFDLRVPPLRIVHQSGDLLKASRF